MKRDQLLKVWGSLKPKLQKLTYLNQHKALIKDALEVYLFHISSNFPELPPLASERDLAQFAKSKSSNYSSYQEELVQKCRGILEKLKD